MKMETTQHVSFSAKNVEEAVEYYTSVFGFEVAQRNSGWVELKTGALKIYICEDDGHQSCLNVLVDDIAKAEQRIVESGGEVYGRLDKEVLVTDKFGQAFCLSPRA